MKLGFFQAVKYDRSNKSVSGSILEKVDDYFYLFGKKAQVLQGRTNNGKETVILSNNKPSVLVNIAKIVSYFTVIIPVIMLSAKIILRSTHSFKLIDPKSKLEKGINFSDETLSKLQRLMSKIEAGETHNEIIWLSQGNNLVFKLAGTPDLVFKMTKPSQSILRNGKLIDSISLTNERFANMIKAKEVCLIHQLSLLIIPHAKKIEIAANQSKYTLIAEETLDINTNESINEEKYHNYSTTLNETARQLAVFIAKTGFNDVAWRNIPLLNESPEYQGPRRIGLIDLEHMKSILNGFIGDDNGSRGLINCLSNEQIDIVIAESKKLGLAIPDILIKELKERRLKELESDKKLQNFYTANGIITGKEAIQVDLDSLNLDLTEEGKISVDLNINDEEEEEQIITMRKVAQDVVNEINRLLLESSNDSSTKGKRTIVLSTKKGPLSLYTTLGLPQRDLFNTEGEEKLWLRRIIQALVERGHLFKINKIEGRAYFLIQA